MNIDERIKYEYENMLQAIMPSERIQHANKLAKLQKEKQVMEQVMEGDTSLLDGVLIDE